MYSIKKQRHIARPLLCETGPRRKIPYEGGRTQPIFLFLLFALSNISSSVPNKKNVKMFPFFFPHGIVYGLIYTAYGVINHPFMRTGNMYIKKSIQREIEKGSFIQLDARCNYTSLQLSVYRTRASGLNPIQYKMSIKNRRRERGLGCIVRLLGDDHCELW